MRHLHCGPMSMCPWFARGWTSSTSPVWKMGASVAGMHEEDTDSPGFTHRGPRQDHSHLLEGGPFPSRRTRGSWLGRKSWSWWIPHGASRPSAPPSCRSSWTGRKTPWCSSMCGRIGTELAKDGLTPSSWRTGGAGWGPSCCNVDPCWRFGMSRRGQGCLCSPRVAGVDCQPGTFVRFVMAPFATHVKMSSRTAGVAVLHLRFQPKTPLVWLGSPPVKMRPGCSRP